MKPASGTVPGASTPAPAVGKPKPKPKPITAMSRIKLALLDRYEVPGESAGNDPYNTTKGTTKPDHWRGNARRI